ncbi:MAG: HlyD family efflux transporter periplasmic adaptor subunit [Acidimicrobiia bacterium]|nr:HlyD family efflux transporter periplasmic adaptor subunit [Acidimicrobiia bacterium]
MSTRKRLVIFGSIAAVVVAGVLGGRALADSSSQVASFRTATVKRATVAQTEQRSGIIEPVAAGTVAFPISGVVTGVGVQPGQSVTAGQTLATLDTSALQAQLTAQQATLAAAQLTLNNALNGISTPTNGSSNGGSSTARSASTGSGNSSSSGRSSSGSSGGGASSASLAPARQAVVSGQQDVDSAMKAANVFLDAATSTCGTSPSSGSSGRQHGSSTPSSSSTTSTTAPSQSSQSSQSDCAINLQAALQAQQQLSDAQNKLAKAESTLDSQLSKVTPSAPSGQGGGGSSAAASTPSLSGPTSAELVADQSAADAAQANVTAAQQDLAQGSIVSPIDGTVAAVNMKTGDHVSAASSTENIIVVGPGGYEVTTTVPVTDIGNVKLDDAASVVPDGSGSAIDGKVVNIGVVPTTSGSTTTYPVVIGLTGSPEGLRNGADAAVTITLNQVNGVLAVPTSAVRTAGAGAFHIVQVLSGSTTRTTPVQVGAIGPDLTEIKSGLSEGQQVVIADLNAPLPSNTTTRLGGAGGGGAFGGGGGAFGGATIGRGG